MVVVALLRNSCETRHFSLLMVTVTVMEMMMMKVSWFGGREHEGQFGHFIRGDKMIRGTPCIINAGSSVRLIPFMNSSKCMTQPPSGGDIFLNFI